jgi:hypothetical protein
VGKTYFVISCEWSDNDLKYTVHPEIAARLEACEKINIDENDCVNRILQSLIKGFDE